MLGRVLIVVGLVLCAVAFFGGHVDPLTPLREVALGAGLIGVGCLV